MKITFCDICFKIKKEYIRSTYRIWYRGNCESLRLDVCDNHKNFFKDCKTYDEAQDKWWKLKKEVKT